MNAPPEQGAKPKFTGAAFCAVDFGCWPSPLQPDGFHPNPQPDRLWLLLDQRVRELALAHLGVALQKASNCHVPQPKLSEGALIDQFILQTGEWAKKAKAEPLTLAPVPKSVAASLEEDSDLYTETLARLFLRQGKPDRARKIYQGLMLRFPEKYSYFAAQIEKLDAI